ncbi:MAG: ribonuclease III, partial [Paludibacteraceae bacterium]|nr:ribonuclease III [Paludibacteraceae bacterium]
MLHKSAHIRQAGGRILNNERLEYLGDSVIEAVVSDILYNKYPDKSEGELTNIRARIVQRDTLDKLAIAIGL